MASLTLSVPEGMKNKLKSLMWVNWSEVAREEITKKLIFEDYIKNGSITDGEWEFCEKIDWHPIDEFPLKERFKKEMERRKKEKAIKIKSVSDIFKNCK